MSAGLRSTQQAPVCMSDSALVLADIYKPNVDFTIWRRSLGYALEKDIERLLERQHRFSLRVVLRPEQVYEWLSEQWLNSELKIFQSDVQTLVTMFADLFDITYVGMRLELVDRTLCPLFHVDKVTARLVTTYHGAATEWLTEDNINRQALKQRHHDHVMRDKALLQSAQTGDVLLFKGQDWPQQEVSGVVHRSAQATPDRRRLLLTLDMI